MEVYVRNAEKVVNVVCSLAPMPPLEPTPGGSLCVAWQVRNKPVLLVGGGEVAASRIVHLVSAGADITVLAPRAELHPDVAAWIECGTIQHYIDARYREPSQLVRHDGSDYAMILTAIDDAGKSRQVCEWSRARRIPVNVADVPPECDFYFGSMIRRGPLQVMVSTGGCGPRLARKLRQRIEDAIPPRAGQAIMRVGVLRAKLREHAPQHELSPARMAWMTQVCESKSLDELADLDDATAEDWVRRCWPNRQVPFSHKAYFLQCWHAMRPTVRDTVHFALGALTVTALLWRHGMPHT